MASEFGEHIDVKKHVRAYLYVFGALGILTALTVAASYLDISSTAHILIALFIATVKGSLVAAYFMHLVSERRLIYGILIFTVVFLVGLLLFPWFGFLDQVIVS